MDASCTHRLLTVLFVTVATPIFAASSEVLSIDFNGHNVDEVAQSQTATPVGAPGGEIWNLVAISAADSRLQRPPPRERAPREGVQTQPAAGRVQIIVAKSFRKHQSGQVQAVQRKARQVRLS